MSFTKNVRILSATAIGLLLVPVTACASSTASDSSAYVKGKSHSNYSKPGAAVTVSHNYIGHSKLGASDNIQVSFQERDVDGVMTVKILPSAGLNIASAGDVQTFQMSGTDIHQMDLSVSADMDGQYFVNLLITADRGVGNISTQSYGIPIYVGSAVPSKRGFTSKNSIDPQKVSGGVIVMDAQETIIP